MAFEDNARGVIHARVIDADGNNIAVDLHAVLSSLGIGYVQQSTDPAPTPPAEWVGVRMYHCDTFETYIWSGTAWCLYIVQTEAIESPS